MTALSTRPLRIAIDGRELQGRPTGVGRYLRSLLRRFANQDRHSFLVYSASPVLLPVEDPRITTRVIPGGHPIVWEQSALPRALRSDQIDVLLSPAYSCPLFTSVPRVTAMHDLSFFARPAEFGFMHGLRRRSLARGSARVSHSMLACSNFTRDEIRLHLGELAAAKTAVVALGPDDDLMAGPPREVSRSTLSLGASDSYIVTVGTVLRRRNVSTLVRAMALVRETHKTAQLGILGENRSHPFEDVAGLARSLGIENAVHLSGFVSDDEVVRHYAAADLAVFLSDYEGFGLPALEAMSRGVPTIVANRGSLKEMFSAGALAVEPEVDAVAAAIKRLIEDPAARARQRIQGEERARFFSWERAAAQTLAVLEKAAS